jgi:hypothetical protein
LGCRSLFPTFDRTPEFVQGGADNINSTGDGGEGGALPVLDVEVCQCKVNFNNSAAKSPLVVFRFNDSLIYAISRDRHDFVGFSDRVALRYAAFGNRPSADVIFVSYVCLHVSVSVTNWKRRYVPDSPSVSLSPSLVLSTFSMSYVQSKLRQGMRRHKYSP